MTRIMKELFLLIIGSFIFAIGVNYFAIPNRLSEGGVIGITIVTYYLFSWSPGLVNFIINTALLGLGYKVFSRRMIIYTMITTIFSSLFLHLTVDIGKDLHGDTLLAALFAGLFIGLGIGLIFRAGGTSGGSAVVARLAQQFLGWGIGKGMLIIDIMVILGSVFIIGQEKAMYTLMSVYIGAKLIDFVVEGVNERIAVLIISKEPQKLLDHVTNDMSRGLTVLDGRGGYSGKDKEVLYLVINKQEIVQLRKIIDTVDSNAYVTIHNVQEIVRKGYKNV